MIPRWRFHGTAAGGTIKPRRRCAGEARHDSRQDAPTGYDHLMDPEERHRCCWYGRRTPHVPDDPGSHTIVDGELVFCAHPMYWPVVRYEFDLRNCENCDVFKPRRSERPMRE